MKAWQALKSISFYFQESAPYGVSFHILALPKHVLSIGSGGGGGNLLDSGTLLKDER